MDSLQNCSLRFVTRTLQHTVQCRREGDPSKVQGRNIIDVTFLFGNNDTEWELQ